MNSRQLFAGDSALIRIHDQKRFRRICKWAGLALCVVTVGMWIVGATMCPWGLYQVGMRDPFGHFWGFNFYWFDSLMNFHVSEETMAQCVDFWVCKSELLNRRYDNRTWNDRLGIYNPHIIVLPRRLIVWSPFWCPFLAFSFPTAFLWYRDRRRIPPGHCERCGYNLTGANHERCPECGNEISTTVRAVQARSCPAAI